MNHKSSTRIFRFLRIITSSNIIKRKSSIWRGLIFFGFGILLLVSLNQHTAFYSAWLVIAVTLLIAGFSEIPFGHASQYNAIMRLIAIVLLLMTGGLLIIQELGKYIFRFLENI